MSDCPPRKSIERFLSGELFEEPADAIADHVAICARCARAVEAYRQDDSMLRMLRSEVSDPTHSLGPEARGAGTRDSQAEHDGGAALTATFPTIEGYRILGVLGQGGMGIVYRAVQTKLSRTVALKVLPAVVGTANPSAVERFKREATAAAQLHHTNIVPIYDFGESPDAYYYAMELIEGQPLDVALKRLAAHNAPNASPVELASLLKASTASANDFKVIAGRQEGASKSAGSGSRSGASSSGRGRAYYRQVARWMADAADALHFAHEQNIIHRDIKPANFLITRDHRIMVADFGLAKAAGEHSVTMTGSLIGTLRYMSPEQAMAKRVRVDHRTDIYSLGVTMYEMLTFQPAFPGRDEKEILGSIIAREPASIRKAAPQVPRELETICFKAMEKLPDARYGTARAMAEDLRRWSNDLPIAARPPSVRVRASKFLRRHRVATLSVAVSALAVLTVILAVGITRQIRRTRAEAAGRLVSDAVRLQQEGKLAEAEGLYREAIAIDPAHLRALGNLAINLKEQYRLAAYGRGDPALLNQSVALFERAEPLLPKFGDPEERMRRSRFYNAYAVSLYMTGKLEAARNACNRAIAEDPSAYSPRSNLAKVHLLNEDYEEALEAATDGADLAEKEAAEKGSSEYMAPVWRTLGTVYLLRGDAQAHEALQKAIDCKQENPFSWILLARCLMDLQGDYEGAVFHAERGRRSAGVDADPRIIRTLAKAHLRARQYGKAIDVAQNCPPDPEMQALTDLILSVAYARTGDLDSARFHLTSAEKAWPESLRTPGSIHSSVTKGIFWFDSANELYRLREEAESLIGSRDSNP